MDKNNEGRQMRVVGRPGRERGQGDSKGHQEEATGDRKERKRCRARLEHFYYLYQSDTKRKAKHNKGGANDCPGPSRARPRRCSGWVSAVVMFNQSRATVTGRGRRRLPAGDTAGANQVAR
eukprot:363630-Chlamydomonas_euryale.AAC.7